MSFRADSDFLNSPALNEFRKIPLSTPRDDTDNEILDLDCLTDDDESWLYTTPAGKVSSTDISAWLRKDADNLDPATRRALAVKLETFLRRKSSAGSIGSESSGANSARRSNVSVQDQQHLQTKNGAKPAEETNSSDCGKQQLNVSKSLGRSNNKSGNSTDLHQTYGKDSNLNLDLKDIQLLASMQEQDLRQCLQHTNLTNRRRATPEHQQVLGTPPKYNGGGASPLSTKFPIDLSATYNKFPIDLSATFVKPAIPAKPANLHNRHTASNSKTMVSRKISTPDNFKKTTPSISVVEKHVGLRKSLPNLAASRSGDFSLPSSRQQDYCNSEKGSYSDIPNVISPAGSSHAISAGGSRLPTPSRRSANPGRCTTPLTKSGIPIPKCRTKSPAPKLSLQTRLLDRYNWTDGCI